ncbi:hypothetical protein K3757_13300 [Sulfitobacter sp. S223]|uniref:hypothetical protein n=1 Tax=Sulfitobacter sp. S223 TaxID=2867023 RepID=UPI0021A86B65|nr:hypothetical protein [Sulfitobacter sp. S223]UWR25433.1 hypothetical protein K3757_13300 [Sulfitobacter sp. S223]
MKHRFALSFAAVLCAAPTYAQDEPSLMERGAQLFFEGLMQEMAPALDELTELMEEAGPALQEFITQMGPKLKTVLEDVEDWSDYSAPEVLPNGDIIIRRKPDAPQDLPEDTPPVEVEPQIDL